MIELSELQPILKLLIAAAALGFFFLLLAILAAIAAMKGRVKEREQEEQ